MAIGRPRLYASANDRLRAWRQQQRHPHLRSVPADSQGPGAYVHSLEALLASGQRFGTIYADPPWQYDDQPPLGGADKHYATMPVEAICALPVRDLAAPQCHLHLWVTNAFLFRAPQIFAAWGFTFKSTFVWTKPRLGTGHYWRNSHEILLLAIRGGLTARQKNLRSWHEAPRAAHSEKPQEIRDRIEQLSPGPYLELFGRSVVPGWTVFGNQRLPANGRLFKDVVG
jgi:N6-adenosine-specific RNA methylase IME4